MRRQSTTRCSFAFCVVPATLFLLVLCSFAGRPALWRLYANAFGPQDGFLLFRSNNSAYEVKLRVAAQTGEKGESAHNFLRDSEKENLKESLEQINNASGRDNNTVDHRDNTRISKDSSAQNGTHAVKVPAAVSQNINEAHQVGSSRESDAVNKHEGHFLTKEMMSSIAEDGYLLATFGNFHYLDFIMNWVEHVQALGINAYAVGAMDEELLQELLRQKINTFSMQSNLTTSDLGWGSRSFHKMGRRKVELMHSIVEMGFNLILSDVDTVWIRNPIEYFKRYDRADILASSDSLATSSKQEGLEDRSSAGGVANIGILMMRNKAVNLLKEWIDVLAHDANVWDQNAFNDLFRRGIVFPPQDPQNLFKAYDATLTMGVLPVTLFCSGHTAFVQRMPQTHGLQPYVIHATFQFSGTPGKRHRFREALLWNDPPDYFDPPNGILAFDMDIPKDLLAASSPNTTSEIDISRVQGHFRLVHHQLKQIRNAMAIAQALNRSLVVPQVWCGADRWWALHAGTIPGSTFHLPFPCPLDHVLDLEGTLSDDPGKVMPEEVYGPHIDLKESSFLKNPRLTEAVNSSWLWVDVCEGESGVCGKENHSNATGQKARIKPNLSDEQIIDALKPFSSMKVLFFTTMHNAFGGHKVDSTGKLFMKRTARYMSLWCCTKEKGVGGHIWYDIWFDTIPHTDRHGRLWSGKWNTTLGP